jgi:hypothetical protein
VASPGKKSGISLAERCGNQKKEGCLKAAFLVLSSDDSNFKWFRTYLFASRVNFAARAARAILIPFLASLTALTALTIFTPVVPFVVSAKGALATLAFLAALRVLINDFFWIDIAELLVS